MSGLAGMVPPGGSEGEAIVGSSPPAAVGRWSRTPSSLCLHLHMPFSLGGLFLPVTRTLSLDLGPTFTVTCVNTDSQVELWSEVRESQELESRKGYHSTEFSIALESKSGSCV